MAKARVCDQSTPARCSTLSPRIVDFQVAVLFQPAIQIDPAAERVEAVVGEHHQQRVVAGAFRHRAADQIVHAPVQVLDCAGGVWSEFPQAGRDARLVIAPEHVLHAVGAVEHADAQAFAAPFPAVEEHRLALAVDVEALLEEMIVVEHVLVESPGVFGQPERGVRPLPLGQVDRIDRRVADRHGRLFRVDVHRRGVEVELGLGAEQAGTCRRRDLHARSHRET